MKLKHLGGKIYAIKGKSISFLKNHSMVTSNSIFIDDEEKAIIDPSSDPRILSQIAENKKIDYCFFSHSHFDHACSYHLFPDSRYLMHEGEPVERPKNPWLFNVNNSDRFFPSKRILKTLGLPNFQPHERFGDGQLFKIGNTELLTIHTPGHTRGHTCFYFPKERVLYSADYDLSILGPWYGQRDSSIEDFISSGEKLKGLPTDIWLTGHWKWIIQDNIHRRLADYLRQIEERDQRILDCLEKTCSQRKLHRLGMIRPMQYLENATLIKKSEKVMLQKHLERFEALGKVRRGLLNRWKRVENGAHAVQVESRTGRAPFVVEEKGRPARSFTFKAFVEFPLHLSRLGFMVCLRIVLNFILRIRTEGMERVAPSGGTILSYRHTAFYDLLLVLASLPLRESMNCIVPFVRAGGVLGRLQSALFPLLLRVLPVARIKSPEMLDQCGVHLRGGAALILPSVVHARQGSLTKKLEYYREIGFLACKARACVFPISLYWDVVRPKGGRLAAVMSSFKRRVRVRFGDPINPSEFETLRKGATKMGTYRKVGARIQESLH